MGIRRSCLALTVVLLPAGVGAGDHKFDVYVAGSYLDTKGSQIKLGGWHVAGSATLGRERPWLGLIGDLSVHFIGSERLDVKALQSGQTVRLKLDQTQITFMAGPRFTPLRSKYLHPLFAHAMVFGAVHRTSGSPEGDAIKASQAGASPGVDRSGVTTGAVAVGFGYDIGARQGKTLTVRLQADYVLPVSSDAGHGWRYSAGLVYRFQFAEAPPHPEE